jgi:hypothetical protein
LIISVLVSAPPAADKFVPMDPEPGSVERVFALHTEGTDASLVTSQDHENTSGLCI